LSQRRETRRVRNGASCPWPSCVVSHSCDEHVAACNDVQAGCGRTHGKRLLCGGGDSRYASVADGSTAGSPASDLIAWNLPLALARRRADVHVHLDSARTSRSPAALANSIAAGRRVVFLFLRPCAAARMTSAGSTYQLIDLSLINIQRTLQPRRIAENNAFYSRHARVVRSLVGSAA